MFLSLLLSLLVAIFDAFGLVMLLPLFQLVKGNSPVPGNGLGKLHFLVSALAKLGLAYNLVNVMAIIILSFVLKGILRFCDAYYTAYLQVLLMRKLRIAAIDKLSAYNYKYFGNSNAGYCYNSLGEEINRVAPACQFFFYCVKQWNNDRCLPAIFPVRKFSIFVTHHYRLVNN